MPKWMVEILQGHSRAKDNQWLLIKGDSVFFRNEPLSGVLNTYTHKKY